MRTAPVVELTQAEIFVEAGAAMAAAPARNEYISTASDLRVNIETSGENSGKLPAFMQIYKRNSIRRKKNLQAAQGKERESMRCPGTAGRIPGTGPMRLCVRRETG
jgi:hypothetical protein